MSASTREELLLKVVGGSYRSSKAKELLREGERDALTYDFMLEREPSNEHDENAICVFLGPCKVGYIDRANASLLAPLMDAGSELSVFHVGFAGPLAPLLEVAWDGPPR